MTISTHQLSNREYSIRGFKRETILSSLRSQAFISYLMLATVSLAMRIIRIGYSDKGTPVFDEKHYAVQGMQGLMGGMENNPSYGLIVHPPLGKMFIGIGEWLFGYSPLGWRFMSTLAGVVIVISVAIIMHRLTKSLLIGMFSGFIANIEGVIFVMSRTAMLDIFITMFIILAVLCSVIEITTDNKGTSWYRRWWLLGAGLFSGLAMSVKVSGVYIPALMGVVMVVTVAWSSRSFKETVKALGAGLIYFLVIPVVTTLMVWMKWFSGESSVYRHISEAGVMETEMPSFLPDSIQSFLSYQIGVLSFHGELRTTSSDDLSSLHPWESKPWEWLYGVRPMVFYDADVSTSQSALVEQIRLIGNPAVWWLTIPVIIFAVYRALFTKNLAWAIVLGGFIVGYFPWLAMWERQQYFFYATAYAPFLVMGVTLLVKDCALIVEKVTKMSKNKSHFIVFSVYGAIALALFIYFSPWYYAIPISEEWRDSMVWFNTWNTTREQ